MYVSVVNYTDTNWTDKGLYQLTFNKLYLWGLTQFSKIVYLDSDIIPITNIDELFLYPAFGAVEWAPLKSTFNSGVMVIGIKQALIIALLTAAEPSTEEFERLMRRFGDTDSNAVYPGDQDFLNEMFPDWFAIPYRYNFRLREDLKKLGAYCSVYCHWWLYRGWYENQFMALCRKW